MMRRKIPLATRAKRPRKASLPSPAVTGIRRQDRKAANPAKPPKTALRSRTIHATTETPPSPGRAKELRQPNSAATQILRKCSNQARPPTQSRLQRSNREFTGFIGDREKDRG